MPQNLRKTFSPLSHRTQRPLLLPALSHATYNSLDALLQAMQHIILKAKSDLLQPRQQAIDRILFEAAQLR